MIFGRWKCVGEYDERKTNIESGTTHGLSRSGAEEIIRKATYRIRRQQ